MPNVSNTICYLENIFHRFSEYPRELDGEQRRRHELTGFNGIDSLAGDVYFLGQLGLRDRADVAGGKGVFSETDAGALVLEDAHAARFRFLSDEEPDRIPKGSNVIDLMAALKKSLGDDRKPAAKRTTAKPSTSAKPAARRSTKKAAPKRAAGGRGR